MFYYEIKIRIQQHFGLNLHIVIFCDKHIGNMA